MIQTLFHLFGVVGVASIAAWCTALVLLPACSPASWRTRGWTAALALAVAGLALARITSWQVSRLDVDREAELEAARQVMVEQRRKEIEKLVSDSRNDPTRVRFAEDNPYDALDLAGMRTGGPDDGSVYAQAAADAANTKSPVYRQEGRRERAAGMHTGDRDLAEMAETVDPEKTRRKLPEAEVIRANRLDTLNLFFARFAFLAALLCAVGNYLSHFNRTFSRVLPLPLAGSLMDAFSPKTHSVCLAGAPARTVHRFLANAVKKGESFIYFGPVDDLPESFSRCTPAFGPAMARFRREWQRAAALRRQAAAALAAAVPEPPAVPPVTEEPAPVEPAPAPAPAATAATPKSAALRAARAAQAARAVHMRKPRPVPQRRKPSRPKREHVPLRQRLAPLRTFLIMPILCLRDVGRALAAAARGGILASLPKLNVSLENPPPSADVLFESAWFGRHCIAVTGQEMSDALLRELTWWFMEMRRKVRARAKRSINIVWNLPKAIERETLERLIQACRDTNCKLVVVVPESETAPAPDDLFEESIVAPA